MCTAVKSACVLLSVHVQRCVNSMLFARVCGMRFVCVGACSGQACGGVQCAERCCANICCIRSISCVVVLWRCWSCDPRDGAMV